MKNDYCRMTNCGCRFAPSIGDAENQIVLFNNPIGDQLTEIESISKCDIRQSIFLYNKDGVERFHHSLFIRHSSFQGFPAFLTTTVRADHTDTTAVTA
jgi:hypothetical protein